MRQYFLQKKKLETKKFTRGGLAKFYKGGAGGTRGGLFLRGGWTPLGHYDIYFVNYLKT